MELVVKENFNLEERRISLSEFHIADELIAEEIGLVVNVDCFRKAEREAKYRSKSAQRNEQAGIGTSLLKTAVQQQPTDECMWLQVVDDSRYV
ncbi:unnamed protein product [Arabidopsis lyrata]|nr:unnamed protein product [Arabidopsis lyrata]